MPYQNQILTNSSFLRTLVFEPTSGKRLVWFTTIFFLIIAALQTGQDFLHAYLNGYRGYLADSLIFKVYWIVFIPALSFLLYESPKIRKSTPEKFRWLIVIAGILLLSAAHILLVALLINMVSSLFFYNPFPITTPLHYFASEHVYLTLFFYSAGAAIIFRNKKEQSDTKEINAISSRERQSTQDRLAEFISVSVQNKVIPIPTRAIICIVADRPYVRIQTNSGRYLHASTLKDMLDILGTGKFVRVHRSTIINREFVDHIKSRSNGDYDVTLRNGEVVRMSRNYYGAFRDVIA